MLTIPELAMSKSRIVTTICNGKRIKWSNHEEAKNYFLREMMGPEGEKRKRNECVYIQLIHGLYVCSDK